MTTFATELQNNIQQLLKIRAMKQIIKLVNDFQKRYSYISCSQEVLEQAAKRVANFQNDVALDLMKDYVVSQGLVEEMEW